MLFSMFLTFFCFVFVFKQKTAYELRISDWSSDVCSSDLHELAHGDCWTENLVGAATDHRAHPSGPPTIWVCTWEIRKLAAKSRMKFITTALEIGRASCRERVCQYV